MLDKIKGGLLGFAVGDALGATTEFMSPEEIQKEHDRVTSIIGGGVWEVKPGETTDDTAMTLAVANGIIANSLHPIEEIGKRFLKWRDTHPKDIGITIRAVFGNNQGDWFKAAETTHDQLHGKSAGNGSLMRCLPIALAYSDQKKMDELSSLQSKMTHYDDLASEACVLYNRIAKRVLEGEELRASILEEVKSTQYEQGLFQEPACPPDGFVVHTMKWVLYWLLTCHTFEEVVIGAANMGSDSDTIAAIAGGLKGVEVGFNKLPYEYLSKLLERVQLEEIAAVINEIRNQDTLEVKNLFHP
jgi:ADP-ribosyl-[dinitrogen reductase] hydrolase